MKRLLVIVASVVPMLVAGCATYPTPLPGPATCRADRLGMFAGRPMSPQLRQRMLRVSGARTIRVVRPGEAVTMDFRSDRLTVSLTDRNRVARASCG